MTQQVKISVAATFDGAKKAAGELETAFDNVGEAVGTIEQATDRASASLDRMIDRLEEVQRVQEALQRLGVSLSEGDARTFIGNWDAMRTSRGPATARVRQFNTFGDWFEGHQGLYNTPREAARHRRAMLQTALQGTDYARTQVPTGGDEGGNEGGGGGGSGGGGGGDSWGSGLNRARSAALGFGKSMLALAGINSIMGMAGRAIDNATEEAVGTDTLKRRMGDLGVDFEALRNQVRSAGDGLGVTFVELTRLSQDYAHTVGNLNAADNIAGSVRLGVGMARTYGIDPNEGNQFLGTMQKYGVARDEQSQRHLALLIGDSVARSGYTGKVDEILGAISNYAATAARQTLTVPNIGSYASALTSMMSKGYAGLGPAEAASILNQADSAVRSGGAIGEASQNFLMGAFRNFDRRMSPIQAEMLWQGGLFASDASVFGGGPLKGLGPSSSTTTNFDKIVRTLRGMPGLQRNPEYLIRSLAGLTGTSDAQASLLLQMQTSGQLGASSKLLKAAGVPENSITATGMLAISQIANAKNRSELQGIYRDLRGRGDLSDQDRGDLDKAIGMGSDDDARKALVRVAARLTQEETEGDKTRKSISDLQNALTTAGANLLVPINGIRDAVVALATHFDSSFLDTTGSRVKTPWAADQISGYSSSARAVIGKNVSNIETSAARFFMAKGWSREEAAAIVGRLSAESAMDTRVLGDGGTAIGLAQWHAERWNKLKAWAKRQGLDPYDYQAQLGYVDYELKHDFAGAGGQLRMAGNERGRMAAMLAYERPRGYGQVPYEQVAGWDNQKANTDRLIGEIEVNFNMPDGSKKSVRVPVKPVSAPKAAGESKPSFWVELAHDWNGGFLGPS